jgi:phospholipid transport system substrate-binding protein
LGRQYSRLKENKGELMNKKLASVIFILSCLTFTVTFAQDPPPLAIMKNVSSQLLTALKQHKAQLQDRHVIHDIVNRIVVPHFDLTGASRSVVGRNHWDEATKNTQDQFIEAFTKYVIEMYSSALSSYSDEVITFQPMRSFSASQTRVLIYSVVKRSGAKPINLDYRLVKLEATWKIYDFSVDGVSMVQNYRAQFRDALNKGGLKELTRQLQSREGNK